MSAFSDIQQPLPTREEKLDKVVKNIKRFSKDSFDNLQRVQKRGINMLWNNNEFTPQEIIDALGVDVLYIFDYHGKITSTIVEIATAEGVQPDILLPPNAFTVEEDTIIVSEDPFVQ